ncbi:hypothetical protein Cl131_gp125 [Aphanizomenon phage vB_AphaS-CL131]|nr:hypothetical protein Cl131_gp125 [Aphanizomenon phage vB_AphaS-CL131]
MQPSTSKGILWGVIQSPLTIPKRYPYGTPHHITLQFGVEREDWKHLEGVEFQASTLYEAWNSKIQAMTVRIPPSIPCQIKTPHISISWRDGVKPYESNLMLASEFDSQIIVSAYKFKIEFLEWIA